MELLGRKLLAALGATIVLTACATMAPPQPPSLQLPKPPADLRAARKGDKVTLTWTGPTVTTDRQTIRSLGPTQICRGFEAELTQCGVPTGEAAPMPRSAGPRPSGAKVMGTYTDSLPAQLERDHPSGFITYAIEALNAGGRGAGLSNQVHVPLAPTLPPPEGFAAHVSDQGVQLTWTGAQLSLPTTNPRRYRYRVFRRAEGSQQQVLVGQVDAGIELHLSLVDQSFEWEKTYYYHADTLTVLAQAGMPELQIAGDDTSEVKVFADDVFPPAVPSGLQAVFSGPGQQPFIDLIWAPVPDADLDGYNVYRQEAGAAPVKLNAEPLKTPAYRDTNVLAGKNYLYSVSAIDVRGNESTRSEEAGESVP